MDAIPPSKLKKLNSLDYLRVIAVCMILYDHLGAFSNPGWKLKTIVDFLFSRPYVIVQDFGVLGVALFLIISGFLSVYRSYPPQHRAAKTGKRILKIYLSFVIGSLFFLAVQIITWQFDYTYWSWFSPQEWFDGITMLGFFNNHGDVINGTTWFLIPLFFFYIIQTLYSMLSDKVGIKALWILDLFLIGFFYCIGKVNEPLASRLSVVFFPLAGLIAGEFYKRDKLSNPFHAFFLLLMNSILAVVCFYKFGFETYENNPYFPSFAYALLLFLLFLMFEDTFPPNKYVQFLCKISLSIYVLHMTFGSFLLAEFYYAGLKFTVSFLLTIPIVLLLSWIHYELVERRLLRFLTR